MAAKTRQKRAEVPDVQYLVKSGEGDFIIEVPATWKLTFGYVNPAVTERGYGGQSAHCLRVYEAEKLRAVYANVTSFRDLSIPLARKSNRETGQTTWERDDSSYEETKRIERETEWHEEDEEAPF